MAGSYSNWFKIPAGPLKGSRVFISNAAIQQYFGKTTEPVAFTKKVLHTWGGKDGAVGEALAGSLIYGSEQSAQPGGQAQKKPQGVFTTVRQKTRAAGTEQAPAAATGRPVPSPENNVVMKVTQANGKQVEKVGTKMGDLGVVSTPYGHAVIHVPSGKALMYVNGAKKLIDDGKGKPKYQNAPDENSLQTAQFALIGMNLSGAKWSHADPESLSPKAQAAIKAQIDANVNKTSSPAKITFKAPAGSGDDTPAAAPAPTTPKARAAQAQATAAITSSPAPSAAETQAALGTASAASGFQRGKVELNVNVSGYDSKLPVNADVIGGLAVHPSHKGDGTYTVTHIGTGNALYSNIADKGVAHAAAQQAAEAFDFTQPGNPAAHWTADHIATLKGIKEQISTGDLKPITPTVKSAKPAQSAQPSQSAAPATPPANQIASANGYVSNDGGKTYVVGPPGNQVTAVNVTNGKFVKSQIATKYSQVDAEVLDGIAIYKKPTGTGFNIVHLPTGAALAIGIPKAQAKAFAQDLHSLPVDWTKGDHPKSLLGGVDSPAYQQFNAKKDQLLHTSAYAGIKTPPAVATADSPPKKAKNTAPAYTPPTGLGTPSPAQTAQAAQNAPVNPGEYSAGMKKAGLVPSNEPNAPVTPGPKAPADTSLPPASLDTPTKLANPKPGDKLALEYFAQSKLGTASAAQQKTKAQNADGTVVTASGPAVVVKTNGFYHVFNATTGEPISVYHTTQGGAEAILHKVAPSTNAADVPRPTATAPKGPTLPSPLTQNLSVMASSDKPDKLIPVTAEVYGPLAIHTNKTGWSVTHVGTGYQMSKGFATHEQALEAVKTGLGSGTDWQSLTSVQAVKGVAHTLSPTPTYSTSYSSSYGSVAKVNANLLSPTGPNVKINDLFADAPTFHSSLHIPAITQEHMSKYGWNTPDDALANNHVASLALQKPFAQHNEAINGKNWATDAEMNALHEYQGSGYGSMYGAMNYAPSSAAAPHLRERATMIDNMMNRAESPVSFVATRSKGSNSLEYERASQIQVGGTWSSNNFEGAMVGSPHNNWKGGNVRIHYRVPANVKGVGVHLNALPGSIYKNEVEFLMNRGIQWKAVSKQIDKNGNIEVVLDYVGPGKHQPGEWGYPPDSVLNP